MSSVRWHYHRDDVSLALTVPNERRTLSALLFPATPGSSGGGVRARDHLRPVRAIRDALRASRLSPRHRRRRASCSPGRWPGSRTATCSSPSGPAASASSADGKLLPQGVEGLPAGLHREHPGGPARSGAASRTSRRTGCSTSTYSKAQPDEQSTTALIRARLENDRLTDVEPLFESVSRGRGHYGGKIAFDGKGHLFLTLGDRQVLPDGDEADSA